MSPITVIKRDHNGAELLRYTGEIIASAANYVCLRAQFERDSVDIGLMVFEHGDLMTEWFYADRWYNIFKIENDERVKGYYCNITRPAEITVDTVASDDLALDVFVSPAGDITILDEDEFAALDLPDADRTAAFDALDQLREAVQNREAPFVFRDVSDDRSPDQTPEP